MTPDVWEWPLTWLRGTNAKLTLRSFSQMSTSPWSQRRNVYGPHAQVWFYEISMAAQEEVYWRPIAALLAGLDGTAGLMRLTDITRMRPQWDAAITAGSEAFTDSTFFTDSTGFDQGYLPPTAFIATAASRGDDYVVIGGLFASTARVLRRGDLFEIRPNGIAGLVPHLYMVMHDGPTNAAGATGVSIRPKLREGVAAGDMVVLREPMGLFRLLDDVGIDVSMPQVGTFALNLVEAVN